MPFDANAIQIFTRANWPSRRETPEEIAQRLRHYLDELVTIDESLKTWTVGRRKEAQYQMVRDNLSEYIRNDIMRDEMGGKELNAGYSVGGTSGDRRQLFTFGGNIGGVYPWPAWNRMRIYTNSGRTPDPEIVTYKLVKAVTLATIAAWEPVFCLTGHSDLAVRPDDGWYYRAWISYVPPEHAESLDLVGVPFSERTPDGGLLLSATEDRFDGSNPAHVEGAQVIAEALRPLDAVLPPR